MKTIQSRRQDAYTMTVPALGGYQVNFQDGRATVPADVAECFGDLSTGFYTVSEADISLQAGQSVLIIRDLGLGDVLMTTPLVRHLAQLGVLVDVQTSERFCGLFDGNPHVRTVHSLEGPALNHTAYDAVLDLRLFVENAERQQQGNEQHQHRVAGFAQSADIQLPEDAFSLDYFVQPGEEEAARQKIDAALPATTLPLVAYVWNASSEPRSWGDTQHHAVLSALLVADLRVVVLSATAQALPMTHPNLYDATGGFSLREAGAALAVAQVVLTPDTGLFHLASALGKPVVTYFGAWPITERATHTLLSVVNAPQNCARMPCRSYQCFNREQDGQPRCLSVPAEIVVGAVRQHLPGRAATEQTTLEQAAPEAEDLPPSNVHPERDAVPQEAA